MAILTDFYIKQNDTREPLQIICEKGDESAEDLTGASVKFIMSAKPGTSTKVDHAATIVGTASAGVVKYQWITGDTDTAGTYLGEFQVTFSDARILTYPNTTYINIHIVAELGS